MARLGWVVAFFWPLRVWCVLQNVDFWLQFGYLGLFIVSLIAASIVPFSSEIFVLAMPPLGYNVWWVGIVATAGNVAGAYTMYYMGVKGTPYIAKRYKIPQERMDSAEAWFMRWGPAVLLLSAVPIIGDPICLVAGSLRMKLWKFALWATVGKGWRYVLLLGAWQWILGLFGFTF